MQKGKIELAFTYQLISGWSFKSIIYRNTVLFLLTKQDKCCILKICTQ